MTQKLLPDRSSPLKRVFQNSGWLLAGQIFAAITLLGHVMILTRALSLNEFGIYALVMTATLAVIQFCDCRVWETIIKYVPLYQATEQLPRVTGIVQLCLMLEVVSGIVAFFLLYFGAGVIVSLYGNSIFDECYLQITAWVALLNVPHEPLTAILRVSNAFHQQAMYRSLLGASRLGLSMLVWYFAPTLQYFLLAELAARAVSSTFLIVSVYMTTSLQWQTLKWGKASLAALREDLPEVRRFLYLSYFTGNLRMVTSKADTLLLGFLVSPAVIGVYELAKRIVEQVASLATPLSLAIFPETTRYVAQGRLQELRRLHVRFSGWVLAMVLSFCLAVACISPWLLSLVGGDDYQASGAIVQILIWQLLWLPMVWFSGYVLARGKLRLMLTLLLVDTILYVVILVPLSYWYAATGAAFANTFRAWLWATMGWIVASHLESTESIVAEQSQLSGANPL